MATVSVINRPIILIVTMLLLFAGSCSDSNNPVDPGDIDTDPDPIPTSEINTSFENDNSNFLPGEFQRILIEGASLTEDQITAQITGSEEVTLYRDTTVTEGEAVIFIVPEIAADTYTLTFTLEEQEQVLDFAVEIFEEIENPEQFTNDAIIRLDDELDAIQQKVTDQAVLDSIKAVRADLDRASTEINELSENEKKLVARIIHTHNEYLRSEVLNGQTKLNTDEEQCDVLMEDAVQWKVITVASGTATVGSLLFSRFQPLVGSILTGVSAGTLLVSIDKLIEIRDNLFQKCAVDIGFDILEEIDNIINNQNGVFASTASKSQTVAFRHGQEKAFIIKSEFDFSEEIKQILQEIREALADIIDLLPDALSEKLMKDDFREERQRDPAPFSIQNISDDRIEGGTAVNGEQFMITFKYKTGQMPDETQDFTFELKDDDETDQVTTIEANLEPAFLPIAFDDSISVNIDESRTDTLMAEMASGFEIVDFPSSGSVNLDDAALGIYTYTPNSGFEGEDKFTFRAFNQEGISNRAVVNIEVKFTIPENCKAYREHPSGPFVGVQCFSGSGNVIYEEEIRSNGIISIQPRNSDPNKGVEWTINFSESEPKLVRTKHYEYRENFSFAAKSGHYSDRLNSNTDFKPTRQVVLTDFYEINVRKLIDSFKCKDLENASEYNTHIITTYNEDGEQTSRSVEKNIPPTECPTLQDVLDVLPIEFNPFEDSILYRLRNK